MGENARGGKELMAWTSDINKHSELPREYGSALTRTQSGQCKQIVLAQQHNPAFVWVVVLSLVDELTGLFLASIFLFVLDQACPVNPFEGLFPDAYHKSAVLNLWSFFNGGKGKQPHISLITAVRDRFYLLLLLLLLSLLLLLWLAIWSNIIFLLLSLVTVPISFSLLLANF